MNGLPKLTIRSRSPMEWLRVALAWLGWLLALLQFLTANPPPT